METVYYIFAFLLCAIGIGIIIKGFTGEGGGMYMLIGFCLLIGGITTFNKINQEQELEASSLESSIEHTVVDQDEYERELEREKGGIVRDDEQGEGLDFSAINKQHDEIIEASRAIREEQGRQRRYESEMSSSSWDEEE